MKKREALGKPLDMKFTAMDGREVDVSKMEGKVVLIDFGPLGVVHALGEIPSVKKTYDELHSKRF